MRMMMGNPWERPGGEYRMGKRSHDTRSRQYPGQTGVSRSDRGVLHRGIRQLLNGIAEQQRKKSITSHSLIRLLNPVMKILPLKDEHKLWKSKLNEIMPLLFLLRCIGKDCRKNATVQRSHQLINNLLPRSKQTILSKFRRVILVKGKGNFSQRG